MKNVFVLVCFTVYVVIVSGCATVIPPLDTKFEDPTVPWNEQSLLYIEFTVWIFGMDEVENDPNSFDAKFLLKPNSVAIIPSGQHAFTAKFTGYDQAGNVYRSILPVRLNYDFEPGERYIIWCSYDSSTRKLPGIIQKYSEYKDIKTGQFKERFEKQVKRKPTVEEIAAYFSEIDSAFLNAENIL